MSRDFQLSMIRASGRKQRNLELLFWEKQFSSQNPNLSSFKVKRIEHESDPLYTAGVKMLREQVRWWAFWHFFPSLRLQAGRYVVHHPGTELHRPAKGGILDLLCQPLENPHVWTFFFPSNLQNHFYFCRDTISGKPSNTEWNCSLDKKTSCYQTLRYLWFNRSLERQV